jgi:hypothetical protein
MPKFAEAYTEDAVGNRWLIPTPPRPPQKGALEAIAERMEGLADPHGDAEELHREADGLLLDAIADLAEDCVDYRYVDRIVAAYRAVPKWFA